MDPIWRLRISDPDGSFRFQQDMGALKLDGSPVFEEDASGDCREATFRGMVAINPRDLVEIQYSLDNSTWISRFAGIATQVRTGYNPDAGGYKLVGLMKKLEEVEVRDRIIQPGRLFDQMAQVVGGLQVTEQIGSLLYPGLDTDLPPTVMGRGVVPNYQSAATVLKQMATQYPGGVLAATAGRQLRFAKPSGVLKVDETRRDVKVTWNDVDAEELVSHVRFLWPKSVSGTVSYALLARGAPVTVAPSGQAASVLISAQPAGSPDYGTSVKELALSASEDLHFARLTASGDTQVDVASSTVADGQPQPTITPNGLDTAFWDGNRATLVNLTPSAAGITQITLTMPFSTSETPLGVEFVAEQTVCRSVRLTTPGGYVSVTNPSGVGGFWLLPDEAQAFLNEHRGGSSNLTLTFLLDVIGTASVVIRAATLLTANTASLGQAALAAGRLPAVQAASITIPDWPDPVATIQLLRADDKYQPIGTVTLTAALFRRSVTPAGELQTEISIGQRDTPEQSAAASLIKSRDAAATITAVRASV